MLNFDDVSTSRAIAYLLRNATQEEFERVCVAFGESAKDVKAEIQMYYNFCKFDQDQVLERLITIFEQIQDFTLYYDIPEREILNVVLSITNNEQDLESAILQYSSDETISESSNTLEQFVNALRADLKIV